MKILSIVFSFLFLINSVVFAQDSLVKIEKGYFYDSIPNLTDSSGVKCGKWIEIEYEVETWSRFYNSYRVDSNGNNIHEDYNEIVFDTSKTDFNFFWLGEYDQGKKSGIWRKYDKAYSVIANYEYSNGEIINFEIYYSNGDIKIKGVLLEDSVNINVSKSLEGGVVIECKDYSLKEINDTFNYR